ncbi:hypothetical protein L2E82_00696 [Cichorium intybus]|uniref:Uncharacterized protein n=1 Tax=Cichorium intybus TaxID=13427 RepID=A0ACB9GX91_CICIN|nr:hypothetical protein L2E82_00696 [Cichorium intybus]
MSLSLPLNVFQLQRCSVVSLLVLRSLDFRAGDFGIDLQVCLATAPNDSPFSLLGDVIPHLHAKARLPPEFTAAKVTQINGESSVIIPNTMMKNDPRFQHGSTTEAENSFIETLMSSNLSIEGIQGYFGNLSSIPVMEMAKLLQVERQKYMSSCCSRWFGRDATVIFKPDILQDSLILVQNAPNQESMSVLQDLNYNLSAASTETAIIEKFT